MKPKAVYALSTGRCGTTTLANLLDRSIHIKCHHEPEPPLFMESRLAHDRNPKAYEIYVDARTDLVGKAHRVGQIYGETGPRLSYFAYEIEKFFDGNVKFIHLIRDKKFVVRSKVVRGAYYDNPWDVGMPRPLDDKTKLLWPEMNPKARLEWSWEENKRWVTEFLDTIEDDRKFLLPFERMIDPDSGVMPELFEFIGATAPSEAIMREIIGKKMNAGEVDKLELYDQLEEKNA